MLFNVSLVRDNNVSMLSTYRVSVEELRRHLVDLGMVETRAALDAAVISEIDYGSTLKVYEAVRNENGRHVITGFVTRVRRANVIASTDAESFGFDMADPEAFEYGGSGASSGSASEDLTNDADLEE